MKKEKKNVKKKPLWKRILKIVGIVVLALVAAVAALFIWLTATEYKPADEEALLIMHYAEGGSVWESRLSGESGEEEESAGTATSENESAEAADSGEGDIAEASIGVLPAAGDSLKIMTWNTGYACLGDNADFFMDGGSGVKTADSARIRENMDGILAGIEAEDPDILLLQEVDEDSDRSEHIDESEEYAQALSGDWYTYALNYKVNFIPYPIPPIGKVTSGIETFSKYEIETATRIQLPCPFSWPIRLGNLKRCLAVHEIPVEGSDKKLVVVNLHLEAYDDGEGKRAQTEQLAEVLQEYADEGDYVIAGGDFNQIFSTYEDEAYANYPVYEGKWQPAVLDCSLFDEETFQFEMDTSNPSCRSLDQPYTGADESTFQYYLIDGFIVSSNITVDSVQTENLNFANSDHNPVVMEVTLD